MEEISHEKEPKNNYKIDQSENIQLFPSKKSDVLNIQNIPNNLENNSNKIISYSFDHTKYKRTRLFGINFYHIGNLYVFGFLDNNSDPLFCIDKGWYFQCSVYVIEFLIFFFGNKYLYSNIEPWKQITFNVTLITFFLDYTALIILNPGIIIKNEKIDDNHKDLIYCRKCKIHVLMEKNTEHCVDCDVCVKKLDHHCSVVKRCITNRNFLLFVGMVVLFILIYIFSLVYLILYLVGSYKHLKNKKNK